ncbi:hypothetical protein BCR35DRAFT_349393 [Leucosporidium creatinivorum]|uniref:Uncharacterized protein n=1 Tax=Leucosporidium creatinivorum TaxID=106004 RepID=A0A1Y2G3R1_9BASI|nr:hypothetical protein BCR35DRAFT_349393 [Leucosporidium creatinivorum]
MAKNESNIGKTKKPKNAPVKKHATKKGKSSTYNSYMTAKLAELKAKNPSQDQRERMKEVLALYKAEQKEKSK